MSSLSPMRSLIEFSGRLLGRMLTPHRVHLLPPRLHRRLRVHLGGRPAHGIRRRLVDLPLVPLVGDERGGVDGHRHDRNPGDHSRVPAPSAGSSPRRAERARPPQPLTAVASPKNVPKPGAPLAVLLAAVGGLALLVAAYANSLGNAFHFDDSHVVVENLFIRSLSNAGRFFTDVRTTSALPQNQAYRPLVTLSLAVDYFFGRGLSPRAFHVDQLLLLALLGVALFVFYLKVMNRASPGPVNRFLALFAATLFCVHTTNTETMNLMHARSEILSALGIVVGFLVYLALSSPAAPPDSSPPHGCGGPRQDAGRPSRTAALRLGVPRAGSGARGSAPVHRPCERRASRHGTGVRRGRGALLVHRKEDGTADAQLRGRRPDRVRADPAVGLASLPPPVRPPRGPLGGHGPHTHSRLVRHARHRRRLRPGRARLDRRAVREGAAGLARHVRTRVVRDRAPADVERDTPRGAAERAPRVPALHRSHPLGGLGRPSPSRRTGSGTRASPALSVSRSSSALPGAPTYATARGGRARGCGRMSRRRVPATAAGG